MEAAIIITGFICLGLGIAVGLIAAGFYFSSCVDSWKETVNCQADEISALNLNNLRLRGQCTELATMAHTADAEAQELLIQLDGAKELAASEKERADNLIQECVVLGDIAAADQGSVALLSMQKRKTAIAESMLAGEIDAHRATKRKLSAAKGQITKLKRRLV